MWADWRYCLAEGLRNALTARFGGALIVAMMAVAVAGTAIADAATIRRFVDQEAQWVGAGGTVLVVSSETGIDAGACERLSRSAGINGSALVAASGEQVRVLRAPGVPLALSEATFGLMGLAGGDGTWRAAMSLEVADDLGLRDWSWLSLEDSAPVQVRIIDARFLPQNYASGLILLTRSAGPNGECIVSTTPSAKDDIREALPGLLASAGTVTVADRLIEGQFGAALSRSYATRITAWLPLAAGAGVGVTCLLVGWQRRGREGLYATLGFTRAHRAVISLAEWILLTGVGALLGLGLAAVVVGLTGHTHPTVHWTLLRSWATAWLSATGLASLSTLVSPKSILSALKDR